MPSKIYFNLILCTILFQIIGTLSEENIDESLKHHVRQKRLIDTTINAHIPAIYDRFPYVANVKKYTTLVCTTAILSNIYHIIPFLCVNGSELSLYAVHSGSSDVRYGFAQCIIAKHHDIPGYQNYEIALIEVQPAFGTFPSISRPIALHEGPVLEKRRKLFISGWGRNTQPSHVISDALLRSITVEVIDHIVCRNMYAGHFDITPSHICTYSVNFEQRCGTDDLGVPLVLFDRLVGILTLAGIVLNGNYPDVFIDLNFPVYKQWIEGFIRK